MIFNAIWENHDIKANVFPTTDIHYNWILAKPNKWNKNKSSNLASYLAQHNSEGKKILALLNLVKSEFA